MIFHPEKPSKNIEKAMENSSEGLGLRGGEPRQRGAVGGHGTAGGKLGHGAGRAGQGSTWGLAMGVSMAPWPWGTPIAGWIWMV